MAAVIKDNLLQEVDDSEVDVEIPSFTRLVSTHANAIPLSSNALSPRIFYGTRFLNQAMPLANPEEPLVLTQDPESGESFEKKFGERMGARYWRNNEEGVVKEVTPDYIKITDKKGKDHEIGLYNNFQFNRKTYIHNKPQVKVGDKVSPNQILASSNYTNDAGVMSMGKNARIAMVPYKGYSMDDAIVVSESFAKRMASLHNYEHDIQKDQETKLGKIHYSSVFPSKFTKELLANIDENGLVRPGTILQKGDPIILATRPKTVNSNEALGKLGKIFKTLRTDASEVWDHDYPGYVVDAIDGKKNIKAYITAEVPLLKGDKIIGQRVGQKDIVSKILPDELMLRSLDGQPFDVLLNPLALPSRVNTSALFELALSKIALKNGGKPILVNSYTNKGTSRLQEVMQQLKEHGISPTEEVFDPMTGRKLDKPVTTGISYIYKLHHVVSSKKSARSQGSYDQNDQPVKGGGDNAQAKRLGGLEITDLMAKGGYETLREGSTLRGLANQDYWRMLRQGYRPANPGTPFVFDKFRVLLNGAGLNAKDMGNGRLKLQPLTDKELESRNPMEIKNGKMVNTVTLDSIADGLFDARMVANDKWGKVTLDKPLPNPAFEKLICQILGIKQADMRRVIAGEITLEEALGKK